MDNETFSKSFKKMIKDGLLVEVIRAGIGNQIMVTPKGYETWETLNAFVSTNGADVIEPNKEKEKPKKSGQEKMDSAIKTMVQVGAGISQLMQGLGNIAGDPVKMDMSQAGIDLGQGKKKKQKRSYSKKKKGKTRR